MSASGSPHPAPLSRDAIDFIRELQARPPADRPLHAAAREGNTGEVARLLTDAHAVDERFSYHGPHGVYCSSLTPLMEAAWSPDGNIETLQRLVDHGADVQARSEAGVNALFYACHAGDLARVEFLVERGLDILEVPPKRCTFLMMAAGSSLYPLLGHPTPAMVRYLLDAGAKVDVVGIDGTALHCAAESGCAQSLQLLLEAGSSVSLRNESGYNPLMKATNAAVARLLLDAGADPSPGSAVSRFENSTPWHYDPATIAAEHGDTIEAYLERDLEPDYRGRDGLPLVWHAVHSGNARGLAALREAGAQIQDLPLAVAAVRGPHFEPGMLRTLAASGCSFDEPQCEFPSERDHAYAERPLTEAIELVRPDAVRELLELGAVPSESDRALLRGRQDEAGTVYRDRSHLSWYVDKLGQDVWRSLLTELESHGILPPDQTRQVAHKVVEENASHLITWQRNVIADAAEAVLRGFPPEVGVTRVDFDQLPRLQAICELLDSSP